MIGEPGMVAGSRPPEVSSYGGDRRYLMETYAEPAVTFVAGRGSRLVDADGREYLDFFSGIAVTSLGHAHPEVAAAIARQAIRLEHVSNHYGNVLAPRVAGTLDRLIAGGVGHAAGRVFFANSGAEANECAIKLARRFGALSSPRRYVVLSATGSFHGRTLATLHATGQPEKHAPFVPMPAGFRHIEYGDIEAVERAMGLDVAAVLLEPVQGEGGVVVPPRGYLRAVAEICRERGVLLMVDEVQTGMGRTGKWFGFQHEGIEPDVVTMGKALGNGMPVAACWASERAAAAFRPGDHGSTFGGQPLALSAVEATITVMERDNLPANSARMGERLAALLGRVPGVASVRGEGLLLAAALESPVASQCARACLDAGLVVNAVRSDAIRFAPPLNVTEEEIEEGTERFARGLQESVTAVVGKVSRDGRR